MRIGLLGGTFDPVHFGHLILAEQGREQGRLDQVWFIPAARPPHKRDQPLTPFHLRVEMLNLALAGNPAFCIDELEKDRPGPSYTVDTLEELHRRRPDVEWFLLIGSDCLPDLPYWRSPARIAELAGLIIWERPGWPVGPPEQLRQALGFASEKTLRLQTIPGLPMDISSHDLRRRVADGRSVRYLVPRAVECYIDGHHLYRLQESPA